LLHDKASSHKAAIVREYLKQEKVVELLYPPFCQILPLLSFSYFEAQNNSLLDAKKSLGSTVSSVFTEYLENIIKTH
jgi:hypothetical protein